jgi:hypothetical protein
MVEEKDVNLSSSVEQEDKPKNYEEISFKEEDKFDVGSGTPIFDKMIKVLIKDVKTTKFNEWKKNLKDNRKYQSISFRFNFFYEDSEGKLKDLFVSYSGLRVYEDGKYWIGVKSNLGKIKDRLEMILGKKIESPALLIQHLKGKMCYIKTEEVKGLNDEIIKKPLIIQFQPE